MNKKACYTPVAGIAAKAPKKILVQGALTGHSSSLLLSQHQQVFEPEKDSYMPTNPLKQPKVVCHSPAIVHKQFSTSKLTEKIVVDSPPTVFVTGSASTVESINSDDSGIHTTNPPGQRCMLENISTARPVHCEGANEDLSGKMMESIDSLHASCVTKPQKPIFSMQENSDTITKESSKKKKQTKVIPSRYKQQASSKAVINKTTSVKQQASSKAVINRTAFVKTKLSSSKTSNPAKPIFYKSEATTEKKITQAEKTSTPTGHYNKTMFESDMSSIQAAPFDKKRERPSGITRENISQTDMRISYARYLRGAYIKAAMQKASQIKHTSALNELTKLNNTNVRLQQEVTDLENEVKHLKHEKMLEHQVDEQVENLGPVLNRMTVACNKYKLMAENIDTTRHGLPVVDVKVPPLNDLESSLQNLETSLKDVVVLSHSHRDNCAEAAKNAKTLNQAVLSEIDNCNYVHNEITAFKKMSIKEANLKLQLDNENTFD